MCLRPAVPPRAGFGCVLHPHASCACRLLSPASPLDFAPSFQPAQVIGEEVPLPPVEPLGLPEKLRWTAVVLFGLFAVLHIAAGLLLAADECARGRLVAELMRFDRCGFSL